MSLVSSVTMRSQTWFDRGVAVRVIGHLYNIGYTLYTLLCVRACARAYTADSINSLLFGIFNSEIILALIFLGGTHTHTYTHDR